MLHVKYNPPQPEVLEILDQFEHGAAYITIFTFNNTENCWYEIVMFDDKLKQTYGPFNGPSIAIESSIGMVNLLRNMPVTHVE